mgnify:CR=1 FL=1
MARITVYQQGQSSLVVSLDTRELVLPNGKHRDATVFANEDGVIQSPEDLLDKISEGTVKVVDLYGLTLPDGDAQESAPVETKLEPIVESSKPKPGAKKTPAVTPPAAPVVTPPTSSPLDLPEDEA